MDALQQQSVDYYAKKKKLGEQATAQALQPTAAPAPSAQQVATETYNAQKEKLAASAAAQPPVNNVVNAADDPNRYKQFDVMRQRAQQQGNTAKIEQGEALKRRFAALGNLNSGAYVKQAGIQDQAQDQQTAQNVQDIETQRGAEKSRLQDTQNAQTFQAGEAEKGRIANKQLADQNQAFQEYTAQAQWADLNESIKNDRINAAGALGNLSADTLKGLSGSDVQSNIFGSSGVPEAIQKILKEMYG